MFIAQEALDSFAFSRKTLRQVHQHLAVYFRNGPGWQRGPQDLRKLPGRHRGIDLPRNRQKYQLEAESLLESWAGSWDVRYPSLHYKPQHCGGFPITYLPFPTIWVNSQSIYSGSRISTTATYAVCHQRANQYSRKWISQCIALRALWVTQKLWKVVLKESQYDKQNSLD